jgi:hypothetical protein
MTKKILLIASLFSILSLGIFATLNSLDNKLLETTQKELSKYPSEFKNTKYAIIIDYDRAVWRKRLWVIDLSSKEIVLCSKVSHAWNSGILWPNKFSNTPQSKLSSIGTFKTLGTYESNYGKGIYKLGMRLQGLEQGKNDKVLQRNIVFHSSNSYWSAGCFMTPQKTNKKIIDLTKNGSILYVHKSK